MILCDICGKEIPKEEYEELQTVYDFEEEKALDSCEECIEKYRAIQEKYEDKINRYIIKTEKDKTKELKKMISKNRTGQKKS